MRWKTWAPVYAVFVTFLIVGIWHGPGWNFVVLGATQGIAINYEFFTKRQRLQIASKLIPYWVNFVSRLMVFSFFAITLVFFYSSNVSDAGYFLTHLFKGLEWSLSGHGVGFDYNSEYIIVLLGILIVLLVDYVNEKGIVIRKALNSKPAIKWALYYGLILSVLLFRKIDMADFIYVQF